MSQKMGADVVLDHRNEDVVADTHALFGEWKQGVIKVAIRP